MLNNFRSQMIAAVEQSVRDSFPAVSQPPAVVLEVPADKQHGELACNVAMRLSGILKKNPLEIASTLQTALEKNFSQGPLKNRISKIEVKKPGFINFFLSPQAFYDVLESVLKEGKDFGHAKPKETRKVQIEFVSANPTGPLSVAHARQAAVGDALGNILQALGLKITKEFYVNDEGNQINILGRSILDRAREILGEKFEFPEDNYQGEYIKDMAKEFMAKHKVKTLEQLKAIKLADAAQYGSEHLLAVIKKELDDFGVHFDVWSHQSKIATNSAIEKVLAELKKKEFLYDNEGAVWFKSTALGDDKDRVVKKSDGSYTYLTPDIVYHRNKYERGFQQVINMWGPDHHGYIPRIKAAVQALGYDPKSLDILIVQLATIFRDGKPLSMSTRKGQYISLREVIEEVGVDAARFFFLMRHVSAHLEFDLELAKKQTAENPVFYVQYAHARIKNVINLAKESKLNPGKKFTLLKEAEEIDLIKAISFFPEVLESCHAQLDPFPLVQYLQELANAFHKFYDCHRVVDAANPDLSSERLALIEAARIVLANGLSLLGVSAPEKM